MARDIAQRLKNLRKAKRLSIKEVAEALQVPVTTYREWEYGRSIRGEPYPKLAEILGVSLEELLTGVPKERNASALAESVEQMEILVSLMKKQLKSLF